MRPARARIRLRAVPARDWAERWKRHFHARRVSGRIVIKPTWERWRAAPGDCVVELDPGNAMAVVGLARCALADLTT
jgi:ribosomal protein L11 methyltransferase